MPVTVETFYLNKQTQKKMKTITQNNAVLKILSKCFKGEVDLNNALDVSVQSLKVEQIEEGEKKWLIKVDLTYTIGSEFFF